MTLATGKLPHNAASTAFIVPRVVVACSTASRIGEGYPTNVASTTHIEAWVVVVHEPGSQNWSFGTT